MGTVRAFLEHMDWASLLFLVMGALGSLFCLTIHELSHGLTAYRLGDPTAKINGRLTLNPIAHLDWVGLFLMLTVRVGWAKPVPVNMRNFKNPKRDMALTALAGPMSNFVLSAVVLALCSVLYRVTEPGSRWDYLLLFLLYVAVLSVGLGLFNLVPIPPLDGSKVLFSLLPDAVYLRILRYERFVIVAVVLLAWSGVFSAPLSAAMAAVLRLLCALTRFPFSFLESIFF